MSEPSPALRGAGSAFPDVPVLVLQGGEDLRTPSSTSARIARLFPRARRVVVPGVGHAVLGSDFSGCGERRLNAWLRARRVAARCPRVPTGLPAVRVPPISFSALKPARGLRGPVGRTVSAIDATLDDVILALSLGLQYADRGAGLRGGTFRAVSAGMILRRVRVVPGVLVSGRPAGGGLALRVSGARAAGGGVHLSSSGRLTGRLGGRAVSVRLPGGGPPEAVAFSARKRLRGTQAAQMRLVP
jgi:hypothetical protein